MPAANLRLLFSICRLFCHAECIVVCFMHGYNAVSVTVGLALESLKQEIGKDAILKRWLAFYILHLPRQLVWTGGSQNDSPGGVLELSQKTGQI